MIAEIVTSSLKLFGKPVIIRNVDITRKFMMVDTVLIPSNLPKAINLVTTNFPSIEVKEYDDTSLIPNAHVSSRDSRSIGRQCGLPMGLPGYCPKNIKSLRTHR